MTQRKASGMVIDNASGGTEFEPDALIPDGSIVESRVLGFAHIGKHEKDKYGTDGKPTGGKEVIEQAILAFELEEESTDVERGAEGDKKLVPRVMYKFIKWSSHEKSNLYAIAKNCNVESAWVSGGDGQVDPVEMLGHCLNLEIGVNKNGDNNSVKKTAAISNKYKDGVRELSGNKFMFSVQHGAFAGTTIADVPPWILSIAVERAVDADEFGMLEEIEAQIQKNEAEKESRKEGASSKLEGDEAPSAKNSPKKQSSEAEDGEVKTPRRKRSPKKTSVDFSSKSIEELEDLLVDSGWGDDEFDAVAEENEDDDDYKKALVKAAKAL